MPTIPVEAVRDVLCSILEGVETPPETARFVADSLVDANLAGHDSHGAIRLLHYVQMVRAGSVDPIVTPDISSTFGATAKIDGHWGWGQPAMWLATQTVIELAEKYGLGAATVTECYHVGRVAPYVEEIARAGMIGLAMASAGPGVAPFGGRTRVMGTNPIAWAAPRGDGKAPISLDVATASIAEGKVRVARARGVPVPPGMIVDANGKPTENPDDFYDGGALLTFGAHKGSGLSILAQIDGRGIAGMLPAMFAAHRGSNGPFVLAINIEAFVPLEEFLASVEDQASEILAAAPLDGFDRVRLPGELELEIRERRLLEGVPVPDSTWAELLAIADELGVRTCEWGN